VPDITQWTEQLLSGGGVDSRLVPLLAHAAVVAAIVVLSVVVNFVAKKILLSWIKLLIARSETRWDDIFMQRRVFDRLSHLAPALVFYAGAPVAFPDSVDLQQGIRRVAIAYMVVIVAVVVDGVLNAVVDIYRTFEVSRARPIKSYVQVGKIFVYLVTAILVLATLLDRSPWGFLSGLGALTAVIMLVFKDTILGFVASIQLGSHDMVRPGDWIEMPKYGADGDVIDISLTTVKVQNWDKTISTIPTYSLVSETFKNWRGMSESGGRRIKRAVHIDMNSIRFCDEKMLERYERVRLLRDYIRQKRKELEEHNQKVGADAAEVINVRRLTNIGTFRAYIVFYLRAHPKIHQNMTFLIRHLAPGANGLPIEIYVFSNDQVWANYEALQADIFDHILAVVPEFGLRVFQNPTGADFRQWKGSELRS
jgi:miniconductance mechanosensitive channel